MTETVPVRPVRQYPMVAEHRSKVAQWWGAVRSHPLPGIQRVSGRQNVWEEEGEDPEGGDRGVS